MSRCPVDRRGTISTYKLQTKRRFKTINNAGPSSFSITHHALLKVATTTQTKNKNKYINNLNIGNNSRNITNNDLYHTNFISMQDELHFTNKGKKVDKRHQSFC